MEAVGLGVGVVGLAGLFSACIDCFELVQRGRYHGKDFLLLETKFTNQRLRLKTWGRACGFTNAGADDGDDTLIVAKGETAQRRHKRSKQDVGGADDAPYTTGSICDILGDLGGKIFGLDGGQVGKLSMFVLIFRPSRTGINCYRRHIDDLESNAQSGDDTRGNGESSC